MKTNQSPTPAPKYPPNHLLGGHPYTPAASTDIRKTFERVRKQMAQQPKETP